MLHDDLDAFELGTAYALFRHGQDRQTEDLVAAMTATAAPPAPPAPAAPAAPAQVDVRIRDDDNPDEAVVVNALDFVTADMPATWDEYIGQDQLKLELQVAITSAQARKASLPHMIFAAGIPGVGKTTIARLVAKSMGVPLIELSPPFENVWVLVKAAQQLPPHGILFIDEIHMLEQKRRGSEILLKIMEDGVAFLPDGQAVKFNDVTILGATTELDLLREAVVDRAEIKRLQPYTPAELTRIAVKFAAQFRALNVVDDALACDIADASRGAPREIRKLVLKARDLAVTLKRPPTFEELRTLARIERDGLDLPHVHYLTALKQFGRRVSKEYGVEYLGGEPTMMTLLRETKQGIGRIERYLIERGFIEKTSRGRRLTDRGIARADELIAEGKGHREY